MCMLLLGGCAKYPKNFSSIYRDGKRPIAQRVDALLKSMTLSEKLELLGGTGEATTPIPRLGIPALKMSDGPLGVVWGRSTAFPSGTALAASWDTSLVRRVGQCIGGELRDKGRNVLLGPCVNIARIPMGGRDFESYGEDPYLTSRMAVSYIEGVQSEGVAATVKHFALNNQEYERYFVNVKAGERAINEIYLPAFKASVQEAKVLCVMAAYNKVNGQYCTENQYLLEQKLIGDWGFKGLIMSDWWAVHSTVAAASGALDLEMPRGHYLNPRTLTSEVAWGFVPERKIDEKVKRILTVMFKLGLFDHRNQPDTTSIDTAADGRVAYKAALEGIVLLKNNRDILPLNLKALKSIAVIGPNAAVARTGGGGSSKVSPLDSISPLEALRKMLGGRVRVNYARGLDLETRFSRIDPNILHVPLIDVNGLGVNTSATRVCRESRKPSVSTARSIFIGRVNPHLSVASRLTGSPSGGPR